VARVRFGTPRPEDRFQGERLVVSVALLNVAVPRGGRRDSRIERRTAGGPLTGLKIAFALPVLGVLLR
jgi:hypothetical protein